QPRRPAPSPAGAGAAAVLRALLDAFDAGTQPRRPAAIGRSPLPGPRPSPRPRRPSSEAPR
ncbi:MAG: hypothetical protein ACRDY0_10725, partial [Acidimicrobiales bacterium]